MKKIILMATLVSAPVLANDFDGFLVEVDRINITEENLTELQSVSLDHLGIYKVDQLSNELTSKTWVKRIEPNYIISIDSTDPLFETSWGLENLGNNEPRRGGGRFPVPGKLGADSKILPAWNITRGSSDIKIAVIDTGVDYGHPDLKDNMWVNEIELNGKAGIDDDGSWLHVMKDHNLVKQGGAWYTLKHEGKEIKFQSKDWSEQLKDEKFKEHCYNLICGKVILKYEKNFGIDDVTIEEEISE